VVSFTFRSLYPPGKEPLYTLDRRLGGLQSRSGRVGAENNSQPSSGIEPRPSNRPARSQSLSRLLVTNCGAREIISNSNNFDMRLKDTIICDKEVSDGGEGRNWVVVFCLIYVTDWLMY
jgi:hypothetical protein